MRAMRCQQVENLVVGAPCGVMDQMAPICGEAGSLMALLCQPAEFQGSVRLPHGLAFGASIPASGTRSPAPTTARCASARSWATASSPTSPGFRVTPASARHVACRRSALARLPRERRQPHDFRALRSRTFPRRSTGADVPRALSGHDRSVYARRSGAPLRRARCRPRTRSTSTSASTESGAADSALPVPRRPCARLGALMYESHASYSACGLGRTGPTGSSRSRARRARAGHLRREDHRRRQRRHGGGARRGRGAGDAVSGDRAPLRARRPGATPTCSRELAGGARERRRGPPGLSE